MISLRGAGRWGMALTLWLAGATASAQTPDDYVRGKQAWRAADYPLAADRLLVFRSGSYGRTADVDYMLGTSGCRIDSKRSWGVLLLKWILANYSLDQPSRALVEHELSLCDSTGEMPGLEAQEVARGIAAQGPGASASGKMYHLGREPAVAHRPARQLRPLSEAESRERRVERAQPKLAAEIVTRNSGMPHVTVCHGFVIATDTTGSAERLAVACNHLQSFTQFIQRQFAVEFPSIFITLYLPASETQMLRLAERVHHLQVGRETLGYTVYDDFSIVARSSDLRLGTAQHELVHLLLRSRFGDIPQWLDEGIASVYEVSIRCGDDFFGVTNWRARILDERGLSSLNDLFASNYVFDEPGAYDPYALPDDPGVNYARDMATARYFALYLQDTLRLGDVFAAFRDRDPTATDPAAHDTSEIVARALGRPPSVLQSEFEQWYRSRGRRLSHSAEASQCASLWPPAPAAGPSLLAASFERDGADTITSTSAESRAVLVPRTPPAVPPRRSCACRVGRTGASPSSGIAALVALALFWIRRRGTLRATRLALTAS